VDDFSNIAAPYLIAPPAPAKKRADARRWLRVAMAERDMGIPWWKPRCSECGAIINPRTKTGKCFACSHKMSRPKTAPCRSKAERLYKAGASTHDIARVCDISVERVCQFLRPLGIIKPTIERRKRDTVAKKRAKQFLKRRPFLQRKIMRRYFSVRLFKAGWSIESIRLWVPSAQSILTKAGCRRPLSYRSPFSTRARAFNSWQPMADGKWHRITRENGTHPISAYRYGKANNLKTTVLRRSETEFMVRFMEKAES
jgi:hypothetical protein